MAGLDSMALEQDQRIAEVVSREQSRLRNFIRRRVSDSDDVEDILQEVFYRLVEANRLLMPIGHVTGWLFEVARNRITDLFRKKKPESLEDVVVPGEGEDSLTLEDLLPSPDAGPEAVFARNVLLDELDAALDELPEEQEICGAASARTTAQNLRRTQGFVRERKHNEAQTDLDGAGGHRRYGSIYFSGRLVCDELVELAIAADVWLARDHVLAGAGAADFVPDSLRGLRHARRRAQVMAWSPHGGPLGTDVGRGAGTVSPGDAGTL